MAFFSVAGKSPVSPDTTVVWKTGQLIRESSLSNEFKVPVCFSEPLVPRIYGLPKIHKEGILLRPIVSAISSPTYALAKYLTGLLKPHISQSESCIRYS